MPWSTTLTSPRALHTLCRPQKASQSRYVPAGAFPSQCMPVTLIILCMYATNLQVPPEPAEIVARLDVCLCALAPCPFTATLTAHTHVCVCSLSLSNTPQSETLFSPSSSPTSPLSTPTWQNRGSQLHHRGKHSAWSSYTPFRVYEPASQLHRHPHRAARNTWLYH